MPQHRIPHSNKVITNTRILLIRLTDTLSEAVVSICLDIFFTGLVVVLLEGLEVVLVVVVEEVVNSMQELSLLII